MPPDDDSVPVGTSCEKQWLFIIRHGDRWDYAHPEWKETAERKGDPPLSNLGHRQAFETGRFLDSFFASEGISADRITFLCSPFLRCVQTADNILSQFQKTPGDAPENVMLKPEYSVWEIDGHGGVNHACLPTMLERKCDFPRLDENHESLFVPALPETKPGFIDRCERAAKALNARYEYIPNTAIIIVTHAAGCVALAKSAANLTLADINAAPPCGIYGLTRTDCTEQWGVDHYSTKNGFNGYTSHLSDLGQNTIPWNHFGPKDDGKNGYTGPPK